MRLAAVLLSVLVLAGCVSRAGEPSTATLPGSSGSPTDSPTSEVVDPDGCEFVADPTQDAPVGLPPVPEEPSTGGRVVLHTNSGELPIQLTAVGTPCTVRSFLHLAGSGFYDGTTCHRLTTSAALKVLQCGDPAGNGTGGPGYTIPDELTAELAAAPNSPAGELVIYPRGSVAMAKTREPDSGGSQFFMVYGDSTLPPEFTLFGTVLDGLDTLDAIAARGVGPGGQAPDDGPPATPVLVESATVE